jgi:nicotinamidase-related amidase
MVSGSSRWLALDKKVQPAHTALLVIDMQNDFIASVGLVGRSGRDVSAAQKLAERLPDFIAAARRAGVLVVFVRIRPTAIFIYRIPGSNRRRASNPAGLCRGRSAQNLVDEVAGARRGSGSSVHRTRDLPKSGYGLRKRSCSHNKLERGD